MDPMGYRDTLMTVFYTNLAQPGDPGTRCVQQFLNLSAVRCHHLEKWGIDKDSGLTLW